MNKPFSLLFFFSTCSFSTLNCSVDSSSSSFELNERMVVVKCKLSSSSNTSSSYEGRNSNESFLFLSTLCFADPFILLLTIKQVIINHFKGGIERKQSSTWNLNKLMYISTYLFYLMTCFWIWRNCIRWCHWKKYYKDIE